MKRLIIFAIIITSSIAIDFTSANAQQNLTSEEIVQSLKPKPRTRGLGAPTLSTVDKEFLDNIKTRSRGLTVEERDKVADIATTSNFPAIDLEINFALNSVKLENSALITLQKLGMALRSNELLGASFLVSGYTDARGARDYNQKLSEQRAETVKTYLIQNFQIDVTRLLAVGYGQEHLKNGMNPLADENRRVQIVNMGK
jgi:outer membrane protein OmpA-like peptidoglycan-associated protein